MEEIPIAQTVVDGAFATVTPPAQKRPSEKADGRSWTAKWRRNQGLILVLCSEMFGAVMVATARLLQNGTAARPGMNTVQILFVRFSITCVCSMLYMWYTNVPDFPWGMREVRGLLVVRGMLGFVGAFGFYYSVKYLPLAEAVVISFLIPLLTAWFCSKVLHTPFTGRQLAAGLISLSGVVLIAQPSSLFALGTPASEDDTPVDPNAPTQSTTIQRLSSIGLGIVADIAAASVYTIIRVIGHRAHPVISVNYYAIFATLISFFAILLIPSLSFQLPRDAREWFLLFSLGITGFLLQFMMTKGLQLDKTSRATNMMYSQIVFAIALDWSIWNVLPGPWSWVGGAIVIGSTIWVALQKVEEDVKKEGDAEYGLLAQEEDDDESHEREEGSEDSPGVVRLAEPDENLIAEDTLKIVPEHAE